MARTQGTKDIVGWQEHSLVRDLALGAESGEALAEKYDIAPQTVRDFKRRKKARIAAVLADWENEFSDLWRVKKHNRVAELEWLAEEQVARLEELKEDAERATETMRRVDPDAAPVRVPIREWNACTRQLARLNQQIAQEMGQDAAHIDAIAHDHNVLFKLRQLGLHPTYQVKAQAKELRGEPPDPTPEERERERREESRARTVAMVQQLMASIRSSALDPELDNYEDTEGAEHVDEPKELAEDGDAVQDVTPAPEEDESVEIFRVMPPSPEAARAVVPEPDVVAPERVPEPAPEPVVDRLPS
jgi:hypothetical protein